MNIFLIPYTWARHVVMGLMLALLGAGVWWTSLATVVLVGPWLHDRQIYWSQPFETGSTLTLMSMVLAGGSLAGESAIRRRSLRWRIFLTGFASFLAFLGSLFLLGLYGLLVPYLIGESLRPALYDGSLVSLRYRLLSFVLAGFAAGVAAWLTRLAAGVLASRGWQVDRSGLTLPGGLLDWLLLGFHHIGGGVASAMLAVAAWHAFGFYKPLSGNLYLGSGLAFVVWGAAFGLLVWAIPDHLYAGWLRVLSAERYGRRIPVDHVDGTLAERFVGHFPRGLDLYLPADRGVAELHVSVLVDRDQRYSVRGLSVRPTMVRRFLERIDLRWDPRRPAPLETSLGMEDRITLGDKDETVLEFLLLPKEER